MVSLRVLPYLVAVAATAAAAGLGGCKVGWTYSIVDHVLRARIVVDVYGDAAQGGDLG